MCNVLYTAEGEALQGVPWQSYPRPQMRRDSYLNLNGQWEFVVCEEEKLPDRYDKTILVPFCPESVLSGIKTHFPEGMYLFYRRTFSAAQIENKGRILLHIGAADQVADVYVNGRHMGNHVGGYEAFTVDITEAVQAENQLVIRVWDDLRSKVLPYGKQTINRGGMWYTPVSGIWQTVWLESVPETYIQRLETETSENAVTVRVIPAQSGRLLFENRVYPLQDGQAVLRPENPLRWTPENPHLYEFTVETDYDKVESYFALRTLEIKQIGGIPRLCLNGKPYFFHGLLDQGYWSDGIYTPAAPECYAQDILAMKKLGFNTLRKHIKVEPEPFYYACDRLGMLVWQDMVNNGTYHFFRDTVLPNILLPKLSDLRLHKDPKTRKAFLMGMEATVRQLKNHPCIVYWTIFNEGWGQFCASAAYAQLKQMDDTRFIDSTSGWFRCADSDVDSRHIYFGPWGQLKAGKKPLVLSEFGGHCYAVAGHLFDPNKAYGYKSCKTLEAFRNSVERLYRKRILPAVEKGLCGAIYTQVSDVEEEINGFLTYDRKICKADERTMKALAEDLADAIKYQEG